MITLNRRRVMGKETLLPVGYTQVEYISSTGTQYIDIGLPEDGCDFMELEFSDAGNSGFFFVNSSSQVGIRDSRYGTTVYGRYKIKQVLNGNFWVFTNLTNGTVYTQNIISNNNLFLFALNNSSSAVYFCYVRVYSFTCSLNGEKKRDMVPCTAPGGIAGMYDLVEGKFYSSPNNSLFVAGPVV